VKRLLRYLADMSLRGKVALALTIVFLGSVGVMLLVLVPFLAEQRQRLIEQDRRLLSTLRRSYERDFIYDLLSRNRESLAVHLADLAAQERLVPLLEGKVARGGKATAYVCERQVCERPTSDPERLAAQLAAQVVHGQILLQVLGDSDAEVDRIAGDAAVACAPGKGRRILAHAQADEAAFLDAIQGLRLRAERRHKRKSEQG